MLARAQAVHPEVDTRTENLPGGRIPDLHPIPTVRSGMNLKCGMHRMPGVRVDNAKTSLLGADDSARDFVLVRGSPIVSCGRILGRLWLSLPHQSMLYASADWRNLSSNRFHLTAQMKLNFNDSHLGVNSWVVHSGREGPSMSRVDKGTSLLDGCPFAFGLFVSLLVFFAPIAPTNADENNPAGRSLFVSDASFVDCLKRAESWWQDSSDPQDSFALECRRRATDLLPRVLKCLGKESDRSVVELVRGGKPPRNAVDASEWVRFAALRVIYALRKDAAPAIPDLLTLLEDRSWDGRHAVACAFEFIGPSSGLAKDIALQDLNSPSESIRQQGVILVAAGAKYDEAMVSRLVEATKDPASRIRQTAIGYLSHAIFFSPQAAPCLFRIIKDGGEDGGYASQTLRLRESEARLGRLYVVKHPDETRTQRPVVDR